MTRMGAKSRRKRASTVCRSAVAAPAPLRGGCRSTCVTGARRTLESALVRRVLVRCYAEQVSGAAERSVGQLLLLVWGDDRVGPGK